jgi:hypothetical protein
VRDAFRHPQAVDYGIEKAAYDKPENEENDDCHLVVF